MAIKPKQRTQPARAAHVSRVEPMPSLRILAAKIVEESRRQQSRDRSPFTRSDLHEITRGHFDLSVFNEEFLTWVETLCNFYLYGYRTFLVNQLSSAILGVTDPDPDFVDGDNLYGAPFPSFAVLFTDPSTLRAAERIMCSDANARLHNWVLQSVTAYITETKLGNGRHIRIIFGCDDGQQFPGLLMAEFGFRPGATVREILESFGRVDIGDPVRGLVQIALHAIMARICGERS